MAEKIENSRFLKNLYRDITNDYTPDESFCVLNLSNFELEYRDDYLEKEVIIHPLCVLQVNYPKTSFTITRRNLNDEVLSVTTIPNTIIKNKNIAIKIDKGLELKYENFSDYIKSKWLSKIIKKSDIIHVSDMKYKIIKRSTETKTEKILGGSIIKVLLILVLSLYFVSLLFTFFYMYSGDKLPGKINI